MHTRSRAANKKNRGRAANVQTRSSATVDVQTRTRASDVQARGRATDVHNHNSAANVQTCSHANDDARKLLIVIKRIDVNLVTSLLRRGAYNVNTHDPETNQPILTAMAQNHDHATDIQTLSGSTDVHTSSRADAASLKLCNAVRSNDVNLVTSLLRRRADVNATDPETNQPIIMMAMSASIDVVKLLLSYGADVNRGCTEYSSPLHFAIRKLKSAEIVQLLLEAGADVNHIDKGWQSASPLYAAADIGVTRIAELLLSHGADVNLVTTHKAPRTALCRAAECGFVRVAELLLRHGADVTLHAPLSYALLNKRCSAATVELLLKNGADVNTKRGRCPLLVEVTRVHTYGVNRVMIDHGANVNVNVPGCRNVVLINVVNRLKKALRGSSVPAHQATGWLDVLQRVVARCKSYDCGVVKTQNVTYLAFFFAQGTPFSWGKEPRSVLLPCLIEVECTPKELRCCRMLLRHGVTESFRDIFEVVYYLGGRPVRGWDYYSKMLAGDFCSASFVRLMIVAGVDFSRAEDVMVWIRDNSRFDAYLNMLEKELKRPRSLQDYCVMTVRRTLPKAQLWRNIDSLPLPALLKDSLKLKSL